MIEELKIITFVCTGLNEDTKILISALKQIKSFKELFVGGIVFDDDIFNLRKCFHYYISYEHNQKINPTKSPREQFRKNVVAIEICRPKRSVSKRLCEESRIERIISQGLNIRRAYCSIIHIKRLEKDLNQVGVLK